MTYTPYGTNLSSAGDSETPYGFTGEVTDGTGNIYLRARYYNPNDGRFINRDTFPGYLTLSQSQNRFIYVENNPIRYTDPTGQHYSLDDFINEAQSLINDPVQHTLNQIEKNRNLPFECTDVGQIVQWAAPALAPLIIVAAIPMLLVSPDSAIDFASMIYDHQNGDYQAFYLDAMALMIPGVTGLGMLSKADEAYDGYRFMSSLYENKRVLIVGETSFEYSLNLRKLRPNLDITATSYESFSALMQKARQWGYQLPQPSQGLRMIDNIDARILESYFPRNAFDAVIFNNPHILDGDRTGALTSELISDFIGSANSVLRYSGEVHVNVTRTLIDKYDEIRRTLNMNSTIGLFRDSEFYAPYMARYTTGQPYPFWSPQKSGSLINAVFSGVR